VNVPLVTRNALGQEFDSLRRPYRSTRSGTFQVGPTLSRTSPVPFGSSVIQVFFPATCRAAPIDERFCIYAGLGRLDFG
jgi:hypothetical protein